LTASLLLSSFFGDESRLKEISTGERRLLKRSLDHCEKSDAAKASFLPVPTDATFFHLTHPRAGSQWLRAILKDLYGPATVAPENFQTQVISRPIDLGKVYVSTYLSKQEFDALSLPGHYRRIVLIRDLRDTLVSAYFSIRHSHAIEDPLMEKWRMLLSRWNEEEGIMYLIEIWLNVCAYIQDSWLKSGERVFRLEDCMADASGMLEKMLESGWGLLVERQRLEDVTARYSFERLSGGRERGKEDVKSHYRKGVHGDWRNHFTPAITRRFKALYGEVLIMGGYENDANW
jgi:lipopolysaccharide transport system ATP-binding protein